MSSEEDEQMEPQVEVVVKKTRKSKELTVKRLKELMQIDPEIIHHKDHDGKTLMMLEIRKFKIVRKLLECGSDPNAKDNTGKTVLMYAAENSNICCNCIQLLVDYYNADITSIDQLNQNVLFYLVSRAESFTAENFRFFIRRGINVLQENHMNSTILQLAVFKFICLIDPGLVSEDFDIDVYKDYFKAMIRALRCLYELPQFTDPSFRFNEDMPLESQPQHFILSDWYRHVNNLPVLEFMFDKPHLINPNVIMPKLLECAFFVFFIFITSRPNFSPLGLLFNFNDLSFAVDLTKFKPIILKLLTYGYTLSHPNCISPLCLVLIKFVKNDQTQLQYVTEWNVNQNTPPINNAVFEMTKFLIENGEHVEHKYLQFFLPPDLRDISTRFFIPDAVIIALFKCHLLSLRLMLPHVAIPPLCLLPFQNTGVIAATALFPMLAEWGPVPLGTELYRHLSGYMQEIHQFGNLPDAVYDMFNRMHSSPPSLQHLCRSTIRMDLAERASQHGGSLPALIESSKCPHFLLDYLKMIPDEPLNISICRDPLLAKLAQENLRIYGTRCLPPEPSDSDDSD